MGFYEDKSTVIRSLVVPHFDGHPLASRPILMDGNARPHNPYSARLSATGGNRATTLVSHVTGYESDKAFMGLSRTKSERTYPEVSKHSGIRDCFGSGMATVPSTQTETLDSRILGDVFRNCTGCEAVILVIDFIMSNIVEN